MNHVYRSIWNAQTATFVAVSEIRSSHGRGGAATARADRHSPANTPAAVSAFVCKSLAVVLAIAFSPMAWSAPTGGVVVPGAGSAVIVTTVPNTTTIVQTTPKAIIEWQGFGIGAGETVNFQQPSTSSVTLNRVVGADASGIFGTLTANGQVFLVNPNGILFGPTSSVSVGGIVASTLAITNNSFLAGTNEFAGGNSGVVLNQGNITAADGGYVALLGAQVSNEGVIVAKLGTVALASGTAVTLDVANDKLLNVTVSQGVLDALVQNGGTIQSDGGLVIMSAKNAGALLATVVNNTGVIRAQTISNTAGRISLVGDMVNGGVMVGGTLDASAPVGGNGGVIETRGSNVKVADGTVLTTLALAPGQTGSWLLNSNDLTIANTNGDVSATTLNNALLVSNVELRASSGGAVGTGNVNVKDAVNWAADDRLTLTATNNINVGANLDATGANAGITLNSNTAALGSGDTPSGTGKMIMATGSTVNLPNVSSAGTNALSIDGLAYTVINTLGVPGSMSGSDLQGMNGNTGGLYALGRDIDASATQAWNGGEGFLPVGSTTTNFTGTLNGLGHTISDLTINRPSLNYVGLIGYATSGAVVKNVSLKGGSISGGLYVGSLAGWITGTTSGSSSTLSVTGAGDYVGGLVGWSTGPISDSFATGAVTGAGNYVGGLVGQITGPLSCTYATGNVSANGSYIGGLAGWITGDINTSYATGAVNTQGSQVGGLAGWVTGNTSNSYATGSATTVGSQVGGLIGWNSGDVTNSYATGSAQGAANLGGIVGQNLSGTVTNSFWDSEASGVAASAGGGVPMDTANMKQQVNFISPTTANNNTTPAWDFASTWIMTNGTTYPQLRPCCVADTTVAPSTVALPAARAIVAPVLPAVVVVPPVVVIPPVVVVPPVVDVPPVVVVPPIVVPPVVVTPPVTVPPVATLPPVVTPPSVVDEPSAATPTGGPSTVVSPAPSLVAGPVATPVNTALPFRARLPLVLTSNGNRFAWQGMQPTPPSANPPSSRRLSWVPPALALVVAPAAGMVPALYVDGVRDGAAMANGAPAGYANGNAAPYSDAAPYGTPDSVAGPNAAQAGTPYSAPNPHLAPLMTPTPYVAPYRKPKQERN
jgi:filamentous hemagglutinin family protein